MGNCSELLSLCSVQLFSALRLPGTHWPLHGVGDCTLVTTVVVTGCSAEAALAGKGVTRKEQERGILAGPGSSVGDGSKPGTARFYTLVRMPLRMGSIPCE